MSGVRLLSAGCRRAWPVPVEIASSSAVLAQCEQAGGGDVSVQHSEAAIEALVTNAPCGGLSLLLLVDLLQVCMSY